MIVFVIAFKNMNNEAFQPKLRKAILDCYIKNAMTSRNKNRASDLENFSVITFNMFSFPFHKAFNFNNENVFRSKKGFVVS